MPLYNANTIHKEFLTPEDSNWVQHWVRQIGLLGFLHFYDVCEMISLPSPPLPSPPLSSSELLEPAVVVYVCSHCSLLILSERQFNDVFHYINIFHSTETKLSWNWCEMGNKEWRYTWSTEDSLSPYTRQQENENAW